MTGTIGRREAAGAQDGRPCPLCGYRASGPGVPRRGGAPAPGPVRCAACGVVFVDPIPASAVSPASYGPGYYDPWQGPEERPRLRLWRRRLRLIEERCRAGTLLDVGCGDGLFLKVARAAGWSADGIEFSPEGARRSSLRIGRPVAVGDLATEKGLRGPFDVVTLWHVLEHLADPGAMLEAVRGRLRPGGLLVVAVPNIDNYPLRAAYLLARRRPLPLYEEKAREPHLTHFSPATLRAALAGRGFAEVEILADRCALTIPKRAIDALAAALSRLTGVLMTDAILACARAPR